MSSSQDLGKKIDRAPLLWCNDPVLEPSKRDPWAMINCLIRLRASCPLAVNTALVTKLVWCRRGA